MFRRLAGCAVAAAVICLAPGAQAQSASSADMLQNFQTLCVNGLADRAAFRQAVQGSGWMPAPEGMFPADPMIRDPEVWIQSSRVGMYFAFVAEMEYSDGGEVIPMDACAVGVLPAPADFFAALDAFAGGNQLQGFDTEPTDRAYGFRVVDGRAVPAEPMGSIQMARALLNNEMNIVMGRSEPDMSLLMYMAPTF